jgi:hypothetical protein
VRGKESGATPPFIPHLEAREGVEAVDNPEMRGPQVWLDERLVHGVHRLADLVDDVLGVVAQVAFERHVLKPGLMLKGKGLKPAIFQLWFRESQRAPPHLGLLPAAVNIAHHALDPGVAARVAFET